MINPEVQQHLISIIQNHGRIALSDPANVEKLLREAAGDSRDVNLLVMALQSGIPQEIAAGTADGPALASKLESDKFIAAEAAQAAVQAWASALGANLSFAAAPAAVIVEEPIAAPAPVAPAPIAPEPVAPAPVIAAPAPAPVAPAPVAPAPVAPAPAPAVAQPAPAPYAPAPAPQPQYNPNQQRPYPPTGGSGSNAAVIIVIIAACVVIGGGGVGFLWWKNHNATTTTTITAPATNGGLATPTATSGGNANSTLDLDGLNAKLTDWHQRFITAGTQFQQQVTTDSSETDQNTQLDKFGADYLKMSETLEVMASELDALNPPPEAATIVKDLATNARDLSSKMGEGATAAKSHDGASFIQNSKDIQSFGEQRKSELEAAITAAGFDVDNFNSTGGLKKK